MWRQRVACQPSAYGISQQHDRRTTGNGVGVAGRWWRPASVTRRRVLTNRAAGRRFQTKRLHGWRQMQYKATASPPACCHHHRRAARPGVAAFGWHAAGREPVGASKQHMRSEITQHQRLPLPETSYLNINI